LIAIIRISLLLSLGGGVALPSAASAGQRTVVVLPFAGPGGSEVRRGTLVGLRGRVTFMPARQFLGEEQAMGVDINKRRGLVAVCTGLEVDAVVSGQVKRHRNRSYTATISVVDGGTGRVLGRRASTVRSARRLRQAGLAIGRKLLPLIDQTRFRKPPARAPVAAPAPAPAPPPARVEQPRRKRRSRSLDLFDLSVSVGFAIRNYHQRGNNPQFDRSYNGKPFPEFTLDLDVYPGAPFTRGFVRNLGLHVGYTRHLSISTTFLDSRGQEQPVETSSQQLLLDLLVRWPVLSSPTTPVLKFLAGWGLRDFMLGPNQVLPSMEYTFIRLGMAAVVPITTPLIAAHASADIRPLLGVGQEAVDALGGTSGAWAFAAAGGVSGRAPFGLTYGLTFEYQRYSVRFDGRPDAPAGASAVIRRDPTHGIDSTIRFMGTLGYSL
jgi:hypothetical protein